MGNKLIRFNMVNVMVAHALKTITYLFYIVNIMAADDLPPQGARAWATIIDYVEPD